MGGGRWWRPHSNWQELEAGSSQCLLAVRGLRRRRRLPPGLLGVSGEQPELLCVTQHSKRCCCSWEGKRPNSFLSIIQWLELPGAPAGARGKILAEASCNRTTWAGAKVGVWWGREAAWLVQGLVPQCCALAICFMVPSPALSCLVQSSLSNHQDPARAWLEPFSAASVYAVKQG